MKQTMNRTIIKLMPSIFILVFVCLFGNIVSAATIERTYMIPTNDNQVPIGGSKLFWIQVSGIDSKAVITNVEAKFDYITYGVSGSICFFEIIIDRCLESQIGEY